MCLERGWVSGRILLIYRDEEACRRGGLASKRNRCCACLRAVVSCQAISSRRYPLASYISWGSRARGGRTSRSARTRACQQAEVEDSNARATDRSMDAIAMSRMPHACGTRTAALGPDRPLA